MRLKEQEAKGISSKGHENIYKGKQHGQHVLSQWILQAQNSQQVLCKVGFSASVLFFWFNERFVLTKSKPIFVILSQETWKAEHFVAV